MRYPSGLFSLAFDWQKGLMDQNWVKQFNGTDVHTLLDESIAWAAGKGGGSFMDAANRANFFNAKITVTVKGYADTPQSAGQMAAFAKANSIPVALWELCNEPYLYKSFFSSGLDYVTKVKPCAEAMHQVDPSAAVAIFFVDPARNNFRTNAAVAGFKKNPWLIVAALAGHGVLTFSSPFHSESRCTRAVARRLPIVRRRRWRLPCHAADATLRIRFEGLESRSCP